MPNAEELNIENLKKKFSADRFAALAGVEILDAEPGRAVCQIILKPEHMNANNVPMGGAIFTLADFCFAVASNLERIFVSQHCSITFLSPAKGSKLIAESRCIKAGRSTCLYSVDVTDDLGTHVAYATVNGFAVN